MSIKADFQLDAKGLSCPMPIVKTKKAMADLVDGQILEVLATDKGSRADIAAWAETVGHRYIGTTEEDAVLKHYIRKCENDTIVEKAFEPTIELVEVVGKNGLILDVREEVEFAFGHIDGALSIPLGDLEARISELDKEQEIYVICRTGKRSDFVAQRLVANGFAKVYNVLPGMTAWTGELIKTI
ncbi:sulfurtransferase TusA family protein [Lysinibacillus parviboronicapiens]|uniref:sulfurtransferase TusA family protein n=1 Tax=Lysinibacillus parviboronicapiens TaxID=436516 RepID=UPI000D336C43|nr:sulfurtransferase TusA family protein [Lysinibacillus parviboronicapiens]